MKNNLATKVLYPGISICYAKGKYYMVSTSFLCFTGVLIFASDDLVQWHPIGHAPFRKQNLYVSSSDKLSYYHSAFLPKIYYHNDRFYLVIGNDTTNKNFYVYTDDIYGDWSEPIVIRQKGSNPSLFFEKQHVFFICNGTDDDGECGIVQCEIDITTGRKISENKCIWKKSGVSLPENPKLYHIGNKYYLMTVDGCTAYGCKSVYMVSDSVWGPFTMQPTNLLFQEEDSASYVVQDVGYGDLVRSKSGEWYFLCLGFHQTHKWHACHILGREVIQIPVVLNEDGRLNAEADEMVELVI